MLTSLTKPGSGWSVASSSIKATLFASGGLGDCGTVSQDGVLMACAGLKPGYRKAKPKIDNSKTPVAAFATRRRRWSLLASRTQTVAVCHWRVDCRCFSSIEPLNWLFTGLFSPMGSGLTLPDKKKGRARFYYRFRCLWLGWTFFFAAGSCGVNDGEG